MQSTHELHTRSDGEYTLSRLLVHVAIVEELLDECGQHDRPQVLFMAGGPASGKSTLAKQLAPPQDAAVIDVDAVRAALPEYCYLVERDPEQAADLTHREASGVAMLALAWGLERGHHLVFDGVGADDEGQFSDRIAATLSRGAAVRVCYATVSVEEALKRAAARFAETGRRVPEQVLRSKHAAASRGIETIARLEVERIEVYDMSGAQPRLMAHGPGGHGLGALEVVDAAGYAAFLERGQP